MLCHMRLRLGNCDKSHHDTITSHRKQHDFPVLGPCCVCVCICSSLEARRWVQATVKVSLSQLLAAILGPAICEKRVHAWKEGRTEYMDYAWTDLRMDWDGLVGGQVGLGKQDPLQLFSADCISICQLHSRFPRRARKGNPKPCKWAASNCNYCSSIVKQHLEVWNHVKNIPDFWSGASGAEKFASAVAANALSKPAPFGRWEVPAKSIHPKAKCGWFICSRGSRFPSSTRYGALCVGFPSAVFLPIRAFHFFISDV